MSFRYVSLEEILRLHFQLIENFGGSHGVRDENRLKSVVDAPRQAVFSKGQYPSVYEKAAVYARNIIGDHPFNNGNKRTGITVCGIFLMRNNKGLTAAPKDLEGLAVRIATDHRQLRRSRTGLRSALLDGASGQLLRAGVREGWGCCYLAKVTRLPLIKSQTNRMTSPTNVTIVTLTQGSAVSNRPKLSSV